MGGGGPRPDGRPRTSPEASAPPTASASSPCCARWFRFIRGMPLPTVVTSPAPGRRRRARRGRPPARRRAASARAASGSSPAGPGAAGSSRPRRRPDSPRAPWQAPLRSVAAGAVGAGLGEVLAVHRGLRRRGGTHAVRAVAVRAGGRAPVAAGEREEMAVGEPGPRPAGFPGGRRRTGGPPRACRARRSHAARATGGRRGSRSSATARCRGRSPCTPSRAPRGSTPCRRCSGRGRAGRSRHRGARRGGWTRCRRGTRGSRGRRASSLEPPGGDAEGADLPGVAHGEPGEAVAVEAPLLVAGGGEPGDGEHDRGAGRRASSLRTARTLFHVETDINVHLGRHSIIVPGADRTLHGLDQRLEPRPVLRLAAARR